MNYHTQMGWTDVDDMQSAVAGGDDDEELEAELLALTQGDKEGSPQRKPSPKKKNAGMQYNTIQYKEEWEPQKLYISEMLIIMCTVILLQMENRKTWN